MASIGKFPTIPQMLDARAGEDRARRIAAAARRVLIVASSPIVVAAIAAALLSYLPAKVVSNLAATSVASSHAGGW